MFRTRSAILWLERVGGRDATRNAQRNDPLDDGQHLLLSIGLDVLNLFGP
jgi:hypothetical protein